MQFSLALVALASVAFADTQATAAAQDTQTHKLCGTEQNTGAVHGYIINNNAYGSTQNGVHGNQCTTVEHISDKGVAWHSQWKWGGGNPYSVKSYPNSGLVLNNKKLVSSINHMPSTAKWSYENTKGIVADVSYDLFTAADPNHPTSSGDYEVMIWLAKYGDPSHIAPIGKKIGNVAVSGHNWDLWYGVGEGTSMQTYSFVAGGSINHFQGDIKPFFDKLAAKHNYPAKSQHLITFQFGTEPKTGGQSTFKVAEWSASVH